MEIKKLYQAEDNRKHCTHCKKRINIKEKFFRDAMFGWRASHVVNICERCIIRFVIEIGEENINKIKKEIILENLGEYNGS